MDHEGSIRPKALAPGARVALVAPAGPLAPGRIDASIERCRALGLEPVVYPGAAGRHRFMAGPDAARLADLQAAFDDPAIDAVWALRGGYGTIRVLEKLDLSRQRKAPIPFIGFSDNTTIHARHAALGVISFHGPHPGAEFPDATEASFRRTLFEAAPAGPLQARPQDPAPRPLVGGRAEAPLAGGNLSLVASLCGTADAIRADGRILFLEDVGEPAYRVDRMLSQLRRAGVTERIAGLAFGRFTEAPDDDEHPVVDALREFAEQLGVPSVVDLPFGHVEHNCTLPVGCVALLDADDASLSISEPAVHS